MLRFDHVVLNEYYYYYWQHNTTVNATQYQAYL